MSRPVQASVENDAVTLEILPLTSERLPDLASLFDQGGDPKWCWCAYYRLRGVDFSSGSALRNRAVLEGAVASTAAEGTARGQGIARALLVAAVDYAREHGATLVEAYPVETDGERVPAAQAYKGTLGMFERAGFDIVERRQANSTSAPRPIVRRAVRRQRRA